MEPQNKDLVRPPATARRDRDAGGDVGDPPSGRQVRRLGIAAPRSTLVVLGLLALWQRNWLLEDPARVLGVVSIGAALVFCIFVHEAAHFAVGTALGLRDLVMRVGLIGGYVGPADEETDILAQLSVRGRVLFAAAGPAANLATFAVLSAATATGVVAPGNGQWWSPVWQSTASFALLMGLVNLVPISILDGGRILHALLSTLSPPAQVLGLHLYRVFTGAACAVLVVHAATSGAGLGWILPDVIVVVALALLVFAVELPPPGPAPESRVPPRPGRTCEALGRRPLLSAALAGLAGGVLGHLVGLVLYAA